MKSFMNRWLAVFFTLFIFWALSLGWGDIATGQEEDFTTLEGHHKWMEKYKDAQPEFKPGDVITYEQRDKLKPFWLPSSWELFFFPGMKITVDETRDYTPHPIFMEATKKFAAQTQIDEKGMIKNYVAGIPFTNDRVEAAGPDKAGMMIAWNFDYRWQGQGLWLEGWRGDLLRIGGGIDRSIGGLYSRMYFAHRADLPESNYTMPGKGSEQYQYKEWTMLVDPYDIKDTTFVIFRYTDPYHEDDGWAYIPALRRVRRISMATRSDSFMGTDYTIDDFWQHAGRPLDWNWKLLGKKKMLILSTSKRAKDNTFEGPMKWIAELKYSRWELKDIYIVELDPVWERHPYSKKIMAIYPEHWWIGPFAAFDRAGALWKYANFTFTWSGEDVGSWMEEDIKRNTRMFSWTSLQVWDLQHKKGTLFYPEGKITHVHWNDKEPKEVDRIHSYMDINRLIRGR